MKSIKSKIKLAVISSFLVVLTGCSQSAFKYFDKEEEFVQNAKYTQLLKIVEGDTVKAMLNITYLNGANNEKWNDGKQNFIIGEYFIEKENSTYTVDLEVQQKKKIQLDQNNLEYKTVILKPISEKVISKEDSLYSQIPFRNSWAKYKLVSFEDFEQSSFTFIFKDNKNNSSQTTFIRE